MRAALTIAGSDSGAGAGIQADLKTFSALGVYGTTVITAITAQNTIGILAIQEIDPKMVRKQLEAVLTDIRINAVKIGMLFNTPILETVSDLLRAFHPLNIVLDPLILSTGGVPLIREDTIRILKEKMFPLADILTPNLPEAERLTGISIQTDDDLKKAAETLLSMGPRIVLVKGGHRAGPAIDLFYNGTDFIFLEAERIETENTHGTGCTLSAAIAAYLAKGFGPLQAVEKAKDYVTGAIKHSFKIGTGKGPTHHFYQIWKDENQ